MTFVIIFIFIVILFVGLWKIKKYYNSLDIEFQKDAEYTSSLISRAVNELDSLRSENKNLKLENENLKLENKELKAYIDYYKSPTINFDKVLN